MKLRQPTEKEIEKSILRFLNIKNIFCWKQNTVGVFDKDRGCYRRPLSPFIISGIADILGIYKGKMLAIEVKTPNRKTNLTDAQKQFLNSIIKNGGIAFVATSLEDVQRNLEYWDEIVLQKLQSMER